MKTDIMKKLSPGLISAVGLLYLNAITNECTAEQRNEISYLRGKYNQAFFYRHNDSRKEETSSCTTPSFFKAFPSQISSMLVTHPICADRLSEMKGDAI